MTRPASKLDHEYGMCECCRSVVFNNSLEIETWKEYENDKDERTRQACNLCRLLFPAIPRKGSKYAIQLRDFDPQVAEQLRVKDHRILEAIRMFWLCVTAETI